MKILNYSKAFLLSTSILCGGVMASSSVVDDVAGGNFSQSSKLKQGNPLSFSFGGDALSIAFDKVPENVDSIKFCYGGGSDGKYLVRFSYVDIRGNDIPGYSLGQGDYNQELSFPFKRSSDFRLSAINSYYSPPFTCVSGIAFLIDDKPCFVGYNPQQPEAGAYSLLSFDKPLQCWISGGHAGSYLDVLRFTQFSGGVSVARPLSMTSSPARLGIDWSNIIRNGFTAVNTAAQISQLLMPLFPLADSHLLDSSKLNSGNSAIPFMGLPVLLTKSSAVGVGASASDGVQFVNTGTQPMIVAYDNKTITIPGRTAQGNGVAKITDPNFWTLSSSDRVICYPDQSSSVTQKLGTPFRRAALFFGRNVTKTNLQTACVASVFGTGISFDERGNYVGFSIPAPIAPAVGGVKLLYNHIASTSNPSKELVSSSVIDGERKPELSAGSDNVVYTFPFDTSAISNDEEFDLDFVFELEGKNNSSLTK